ncbi:hypothetical protein SI65_00738 [Aspergillus cristatus]|uniref:HNH nuclease domain-containing protein n=1 Tax=Aspergillus cristatus TaxID=573508 RepID=A0A1E3BQC1_ASPCR|nr:hypothetical protein SI65_00738 [Aspergillus cristatus]
MPKTRDSTLSKAQTAINDFFKDPTTRTEDIEVLLKYLNARPSFIEPVDFVKTEEIQNRVQIVQDIQKFIRELYLDWQITTIATFMVMPMHKLLQLKECLGMLDWEGLVRELDKDHHFMLHFFQKLLTALKESRAQSLDISTKSPKQKREAGRSNDYHPRMKDDGTIDRDMQERDACINRESNACLASGTAYPEACHIVPFAWNSNETNLAATRALTMGSCKLLEVPTPSASTWASTLALLIRIGT